MLLDLPQWHAGYERILEDCRPKNGGFERDDDDEDDDDDDGSTTKSVLILCNGDVDALASARILTYMLRSDGIPYHLLPCFSYQSLEVQLRAMAGGGNGGNSGTGDDEDDGLSTLDDVRAVVMLNFGASKNLTRLFRKDDGSGGGVFSSSSSSVAFSKLTTVYVMDCRRPVHLANVHAPSHQVCVFMDGTTNVETLPSDGDHLSGGDSSSSSSSSSESSEDENDDESEDGRKKNNDSDDEGEEEADLDDVEQVEQKDPPAMRRSSSSDNDDDDDYQGEDEHDDDDDNDEGEDDDDEDDFAPPSKRIRRNSDSDKAEDRPDVDAGADAEGDGDDDDQQQQQVQLSQRERHQDRLDRIRAYYNEGSFYGTPAAYIAFEIASQLRFGNEGDLLWLACVGVTDAYLHSRLDMTGYAFLASELRHKCQQVYPDNRYERTINYVYAEDLIGGDDGSGGGGNGGDVRTKITFSENGRIYAQDDYRFFLLRHSSLLESMVQSDYVSTKLQVWTKKGQQRLMEMLAKMGYPLDECKQPFVFMKPSLRRRLKDKISDNAEEYNLEHFKYSSFMRVTGYNSLVSASDMSYAVTALLERDPPTSSAADNVAGGASDDQRAMVDAFNCAYDSLSPNFETNAGAMSGNGEGYDTTTLVNGGTLPSSVGLGAGILQARALQSSITQLAVGLVERKAITLLRHFRYAYVTSNTVGETQFSRDEIVSSNNANNTGNDKRDHIFSKPLALTRLASYLMDMHRESGKWTGNKARPLVLIAEKPASKTCLVVGYEYPERHGDHVRNHFGKYFEMTANSMNGTFKFDHFDSNVVEVAGADVQRFLEQLHYLLDSV